MSSIGSVGGSWSSSYKQPSFEKIDGNANGAVSFDEFKSGAPEGADSAKSEKLFKSIDSDSDGSISKAESDAFKSKAEKADQELESFLFGLQSDSTGQTDATASSDAADDIFSALDADSSGSVSKDEFLSAFSADDGSDSSSSTDMNDLLSKLFDALDTDGDGSIGKDEQKALQQAAQDSEQDSGQQPSSIVMEALQAYGNSSQLTSQSRTSSTYAQAA